MRNQDRMPAQTILAKATNGQLSAGAIPLGSTNQTDGTYIVMKTNGGSLITIPCPGAEAGDPASQTNQNSNQ